MKVQERIKKRPFYSEELKKEVVREIVGGKISILESCIKYDIGSERSIYRWLKRYKKLIKPKKIIPLPVMKEKDNDNADLSIESLLELKIKLEGELKQARLESAANKALVDIANEEFNIDLRKKHGVKQ